MIKSGNRPLSQKHVLVTVLYSGSWAKAGGKLHEIFSENKPGRFETFIQFLITNSYWQQYLKQFHHFLNFSGAFRNDDPNNHRK